MEDNAYDNCLDRLYFQPPPSPYPPNEKRPFKNIVFFFDWWRGEVGGVFHNRETKTSIFTPIWIQKWQIQLVYHLIDQMEQAASPHHSDQITQSSQIYDITPEDTLYYEEA